MRNRFHRIIRYLLRRSQADADLDEELRSHLAVERQRRMDLGDSPEVAHQEALKDFGNVLRVKEATRQMWGWCWLENLWQDLRHGSRLLRLSLAFTTIVAMSLALGIGANTALPILYPHTRVAQGHLARDREFSVEVFQPEVE